MHDKDWRFEDNYGVVFVQGAELEGIWGFLEVWSEELSEPMKPWIQAED